MSYKSTFTGQITSIQPRIRLTRSFDEASHTYLGYALKIAGCNLGTGFKLQNMHFHNGPSRFFVSQEGKKPQILLTYMNLYFHKSFYYVNIQ